MPRKKRLNVYTANHEGIWLTGYSVVVAETKEEALELLNRNYPVLDWVRQN